METQTTTEMRVGELAKRTGLTVRTLHHYDEIGLLVPRGRTDAGYRLYAAADVARLQQILSLRQLGFSLDEIRACLTRPDFSPGEVVALHLAQVREQIAAQQSLAALLEGLSHLLTAGGATTEQFLQIVEATQMVEKYYTPEQMQWLEQRRAQVGEERIREVQDEWPRLIAAVQAEMDAGTDPADPKVQALARRWSGLVAEFHGGNEGIKQSLTNAYENEWLDKETYGINRRLWDYVGKAMTAAGIVL